MRPDRALHVPRDLGGGLQVVAGRGQDHSEDEVAVPLREILELGEKAPRREARRAADDDHDEEGGDARTAHEAGVADEPPGEPPGRAVQPGEAEAPAPGARAREQPAPEGRDHGDRHEQRQQDRHRDRDRDVPEELRDLELQDQDGDEHHHGGQRGDEHRPPDLRRAVEGRLPGRDPFLPESVDVLEHDDRRVHHHAYREGESGEGDDVDRSPEGGHRDERADDGDRYREHHGGGRPPRTKEHEQHEGGERPAHVHVLLHEVEGGVDVHRLVVDLAEGESGVPDGAVAELGGGGPDPVHRLDDVGADLALDAHRERRGAEVAYAGARLLKHEAHVGDVPDGEPGDAAGRRVAHRPEQHLADIVDRLDRSLGADHVPALALLDLPRAHRGVRRPQPGQDLAHGETEPGEPERIDLDPELAPAGAVDVHPADPRHAFEPLLDHVLDELPEGVDRPLVSGLGANDHPGDRVVLAARGPKLGLARFRGIPRYPVEAVRDEQQRLVHVHVDVELETEPGAAVLRRAVQRGEALETLERLLLAVDDLALDLGRRAASPVGGHGDDRPCHVRGELDGNGAKREGPEHRDHEDRGDDRPGAGDRVADEVHARPLRTRTRTRTGCGFRAGRRLRAGIAFRRRNGRRDRSRAGHRFRIPDRA